MTVEIIRLSRTEIDLIVSEKIQSTLSSDKLIRFSRCLLSTPIVWAGYVDGLVVCVWGLMPPTLVSDDAYLWLYVIEPVKEYQFVFIRHSQRFIEEALKMFKTIIGDCEVEAAKSIRWIKWLGGVFGEPNGNLIPFSIKAREV